MCAKFHAKIVISRGIIPVGTGTSPGRPS